MASRGTTLKYFCFLLLSFLFPGFTVAQTTRISGKILDIDTREPLPFINVVFKNTNIGTTSDFEGNYTIATDNPTDSLKFSYIGYNSTTAPVKKGRIQTLNVAMKVSSVTLNEVVIKAGENPAHIIFRKVIKNKPVNDKEKLDYYQYEVYNKIEFDINNISERLKRNVLVRPFSFILDNVDSSNIQEKPSIPLFLSESVSDLYYSKKPKVTKEIIKATKIAGVENKSVSQFTGDMYQNVNIYDNNILVFGKTFVSPISENGLLHYRYYLIDSLFLDGKWCYHIQFKPKRKQELTFAGNMWINDTTFAVKRLEMSMAGDANINYINTFNVAQDYVFVDGAWLLGRDKLVADFILQKKVPGFYGRKTTFYSKFVINKPMQDGFYDKKDNLKVEEGATEKDDEFWRNARRDSLSTTEQGIYKMVDTLRTVRAFKIHQAILRTTTIGYYEKGYFEIGPVFKIYSRSNIEGSRLRLGGRTSNKFSKWHEFNGYVAYGFKDLTYKGGLGYRGFLSKNPRTIIGIDYKNDYEILGQSQNGFSYDNFLSSLLRIRPLSNLTNLQDYSTNISREWFPGFVNKLTFVNRIYTPVAGFKYEFTDDNNTVQELSNIVTSEIRVSGRMAINEKYLSGTFDRVGLGTKWPILFVQYTKGIKGVFKSDFHYDKISVNIRDRFRSNMLGYTDYVIDFGKIWGNIPYPLMEIHGGNETYFYDPYAFNMMRFYEFVSDEYVSLGVTHHFEGLFLNKIPLMRKLKWREVINGKGLFGRVTGKNKQLLNFPSTLSDLNNKPYFEAGVGVENVFKFFRFDTLWRLSHLNKSNISKFGFRGTLQFLF